MKSKVKKKLVEALRSGDYAQGKDTICVEDSDGSRRLCIIGMLTQLYLSETGGSWEVFPKGTQEALKGEGPWPKIEPGQSIMIPCMVCTPVEFGHKMNEWAGIDGETSSDLADMNDMGDSFEELANWIEENLQPTLKNFVVKTVDGYGGGMFIVAAEDEEHVREILKEEQRTLCCDGEAPVQKLEDLLAKAEGPGVLESFEYYE